MKLWALSDLHIGSALNLEMLQALEARKGDWLIIAGDVGETVEHLRTALELLCPRFEKLFWVPGNHDLWSIDPEAMPLRGEMKYRRLVEVCRSYGVLTPEDPFAVWPGTSGESAPDIVIAPLFVLYDHSFGGDGLSEEDALALARRAGVFCGDEELLEATPHASRPQWCARRVLLSEQRLSNATEEGERTVLINHFPLRRELVRLPHAPLLSIWCGTRATEAWHLRFNAEAVVYGHLHLPSTHMIDDVRFEEVSLGYPTDRQSNIAADAFLRQILPAPVPDITNE